MGGQTSIRPYWRCYYPNTDAIIFVVDSADVERLAIAKQELSAMLEEEELKESILLVFANKQDQKGALNASQVGGSAGRERTRGKGKAFSLSSSPRPRAHSILTINPPPQ